MLGVFLLGFFEEVVERKRQRGYEPGQVGENEGQGLNREANDSCLEGEGRREEKDMGSLGNKYIVHFKAHSLLLSASLRSASGGG